MLLSEMSFVFEEPRREFRINSTIQPRDKHLPAMKDGV
jgi:hypothetical protein